MIYFVNPRYIFKLNNNMRVQIQQNLKIDVDKGDNN